MTKAEMRKFRARRERILAMHAQGVPHPKIAKLFKMRNRQRIWQIVNGK